MHHFAHSFLGSLEFSTNIILLFVDYNMCFYSCIGLASTMDQDVLLLLHCCIYKWFAKIPTNLQWAFVKLCDTTDELVTEKYCNT